MGPRFVLPGQKNNNPLPATTRSAIVALWNEHLSIYVIISTNKNWETAHQNKTEKKIDGE